MTEKGRIFWAAVLGSYTRARRNPRQTFKNLGKSQTTYYNRANNPESLTVEELKALIKEGRVPEEDVIKFLYQ